MRSSVGPRRTPPLNTLTGDLGLGSQNTFSPLPFELVTQPRESPTSRPSPPQSGQPPGNLASQKGRAAAFLRSLGLAGSSDVREPGSEPWMCPRPTGELERIGPGARCRRKKESVAI